jgi:hypothetical protein
MRVLVAVWYDIQLLIYSTAVTGHATVAARVVSIEFSAQLLLVDSPLPTFFCLMSCSVFVSDSSPPLDVAYAAIVVEENIPVNAAAAKTATSTNDLFISKLLTDYLYI